MREEAKPGDYVTAKLVGKDAYCYGVLFSQQDNVIEVKGERETYKCERNPTYIAVIEDSYIGLPKTRTLLKKVRAELAQLKI